MFWFELVTSTFPEGILSDKSLKISTWGLNGYLKLICSSSISPLICASVVPASLLESILDFLSIMENIEAAESLALLLSGLIALDCETPTAAIVNEKKTWRKFEGKLKTREKKPGKQ